MVLFQSGKKHVKGGVTIVKMKIMQTTSKYSGVPKENVKGGNMIGKKKINGY